MVALLGVRDSAEDEEEKKKKLVVKVIRKSKLRRAAYGTTNAAHSLLKQLRAELTALRRLHHPNVLRAIRDFENEEVSQRLASVVTLAFQLDGFRIFEA